MKLIANNLNNLCTSSICDEELFSRLNKLIIVTAIATCATIANAGSAPTDESNSHAYVDSIHQWGAWELDIEPAAGGLKTDSARPLGTRESILNLRTNSISALSPPIPITANPAAPAPPTVIPVVTVTPPPPVAPPVPTAPIDFAPPGAT